MNLDGQIDDADVAEYIKGRLFRYWFNEDTVKGDYDGHIPDYTRNAADGVVNGRYDLINLFAARLDLKPFIDAWGSSVKFELSAYGEDTMRYCAVNPTPLDRNLEWDMKTNLCPNPGSLWQKQP